MRVWKKFVTLGLVGWGSLALVACSQKKETAAKEDVKIGILQYMEHDALDTSRKGFIVALKDAGYEEGKNLSIDYKNAQGDQASLQTMAEQLAGKNDLNLAIATPAAQSLLNVDTETPTVFTAIYDPVAASLVNSLKKPGGNMTGSSHVMDVAKQIELLLKVAPNAKKVGIFHNSSEINSESQAKLAIAALKKAGVEPVEKTITSSNDVQQAITSLAGQVDAIYLPADNTVASTASTIGEVLKSKKIPAIGSDENSSQAALFTYGVDFYVLGQQAGKMAVEILKGADPADMPVQGPEVIKIKVNEEMAKALEIDAKMIEKLDDKK